MTLACKGRIYTIIWIIQLLLQINQSDFASLLSMPILSRWAGPPTFLFFICVFLHWILSTTNSQGEGCFPYIQIKVVYISMCVKDNTAFSGLKSHFEEHTKGDQCGDAEITKLGNLSQGADTCWGRGIYKVRTAQHNSIQWVSWQGIHRRKAWEKSQKASWKRHGLSCTLKVEYDSRWWGEWLKQNWHPVKIQWQAWHKVGI